VLICLDIVVCLLAAGLTLCLVYLIWWEMYGPATRPDEIRDMGFALTIPIIVCYLLPVALLSGMAAVHLWQGRRDRWALQVLAGGWAASPLVLYMLSWLAPQ
jgi:hypothetical protein